MTEQQPEEPRPQFRVSRQLYVFAAAVMALWVFVTFFFRNPYQQAVSFDYYDKHPYDETTVWVYVLIVVPMIGVTAMVMWYNRLRAKR